MCTKFQFVSAIRLRAPPSFGVSHQLLLFWAWKLGHSQWAKRHESRTSERSRVVPGTVLLFCLLGLAASGLKTLASIPTVVRVVLYLLCLTLGYCQCTAGVVSQCFVRCWCQRNDF